MAAAPVPLSPDALAGVEHAVHELPDACERLRYVKEMTEKAANKVFALVDGIQVQAAELGRQACSPRPWRCCRRRRSASRPGPPSC